MRDGVIMLKCRLHINAHNAPAGNKLTKHGFLCHVIKVLVPERGISPHFSLRNFPGEQILIAFATECRAVGVCMGHHLFFAPIQHLAESVQVLKECHVTDCRQGIAHIIVLDKLKPGFSGFGVFAAVLALLDNHNIKVFVLAAAQCQLDIAFVTKHECGGGGFRANHVAVSVILGLLLERHEVILTQLRGRAEVERFAQQGTRKNRPCITLLQSGIHRNGACNACRKTPRTVRVAQGVVNKVLVSLRIDRNGKLRFLCQLLIRCRHRSYPPAK